MSLEEIPVQGTVLDRFQGVVGSDALGAREVGQGAGDFQNAIFTELRPNLM